MSVYQTLDRLFLRKDQAFARALALQAAANAQPDSAALQWAADTAIDEFFAVEDALHLKLLRLDIERPLTFKRCPVPAFDEVDLLLKQAAQRAHLVWARQFTPAGNRPGVTP